MQYSNAKKCKRLEPKLSLQEFSISGDSGLPAYQVCHPVLPTSSASWVGPRLPNCMNCFEQVLHALIGSTYCLARRCCTKQQSSNQQPAETRSKYATQLKKRKAASKTTKEKHRTLPARNSQSPKHAILTYKRNPKQCKNNYIFELIAVALDFSHI